MRMTKLLLLVLLALAFMGHASAAAMEEAEPMLVTGE